MQLELVVSEGEEATAFAVLDKTLCVVGYANGEVRLWNLEEERQIGVIAVLQGRITCATCSKTEDIVRLLVTTETGNIAVYEGNLA